MTSNEPSVQARSRAVFTQGSILRHVIVMTATGSIGLVSVFFVDLLSLLYVSRLGDPALTAGIGFATLVLFFLISVNLGISIALSAVVSRALGAEDRPLARRLAASGLTHITVVGVILTLIIWPVRATILADFGAHDVALSVATNFLGVVLPTNVMVGVGMAFSGILRAAGDARRAMYVTLGGAIVTAVLDPILIFGLGLGVTGAALSTIVSRLVWVLVGYHGAVRIHGIVAKPTLRAVALDVPPIFAIAVPVILTNLAPAVASTYTTRIFSSFGEPVVAAFAIIDRLTPVAFGVLFAMAGSVGPIIGQNYGARLMARVRETMTNAFVLTMLYALAVWVVLWFAAPLVVALFGTTGETARLVIFFCHYGSAAWLFLGCLFAANAAFNNLDFPLLSTLFNWGRATLGTIPFVTIGAHYYGPEGGYVGVIAGAALFGIVSIIAAYVAIDRRARVVRPVAEAMGVVPAVLDEEG